MIERGIGDLLVADVDALVNTVNTEGVMGKGLALQFKKAFPAVFAAYARACEEREVRVGRMHIVQQPVIPRFLINFPTKELWQNPSKLEYIEAGLADLVQQVRELKIRSIVIPPLGCGNGGLEWSVVKPMIVAAFAALPEVRVVLFEPEVARQIAPLGERPKMSAPRAAVIGLMGRYVATHYDYRLSLIEVQKLAYFLQVAGEPLRLEFKPHFYGPYAPTLRNALLNLEGHYTRGLAEGGNSPETPLQLLPDAVEEAQRQLEELPETSDRLERVARLIEGFETPFGMELLGTVHWVMHHGPGAVDVDAVVAEVQRWSPRKRSQMKPGHIRSAWKRLHEQGWAPT